MIWSGLRIYWAEDVYALGIGSWQWFAFFPDAVYETFGLERRLARGMAFHFAFGWLFVINGAIYGIYLLATREWRHILPDRHAAKEARTSSSTTSTSRRRCRRRASTTPPSASRTPPCW